MHVDPPPSERPSGMISPYEMEIRAYERAQLKSPVAPHGVVFYGSSSIRMWDSLRTDFPEVRVINRGYGGSSLWDCVRQLPRLVYPLQPSAMIIYAGDNDLAEGRTPEDVLNSFRRLIGGVRANVGPVPIAFLSIKPAPSRWHNAINIRRANELLEGACHSFPRVKFIDLMPHLLGPDGQPRRELFLADALHFAAPGYRILTDAVREFLLAEGFLGASAAA